LIKFVDVRFSSPSGQPEDQICVLTWDGKYLIHTATPKLEFKPGTIVFEDKDARQGKQFTAEIWLNKATKIYDYEFVIAWNSTQWKLVDYEISREFLVGPYETVIIVEGHHNISEPQEKWEPWEFYMRNCTDWLYVYVEAKCWTPPATGSGKLMTLTWEIKDLSKHGIVWHKDKDIWKKDHVIFFSCEQGDCWWWLSGKCPDPVTIWPWQIDINNLQLEFHPVPGDVNCDGNVNEKDLILIAKAFSNNTWIYDLNSDGHVDILDLVICAKKMCISGC